MFAIKPRPLLTQTRLHQDDLLNRIFAARGITHAHELECALKQLHPYQPLKNIDIAVNLLYQHLHKQNKILIIGDYDADGATATALAVSALQIMGAKQVQFLVPNRFEYGYGLTPELVNAAQNLQPNLIITVDNGISSFTGCAHARELGIDVLVTDHHLPPETGLPNANVIVNPNQLGCAFPSKHLCGVGVIFYVMLALRRHLKNMDWLQTEPNMAQFLDLVALGTIADVVSLDHNNRILVQQGLQRIRAGLARPGIQALLSVANRKAEILSSSDLAFAIAPRLNAAGRLEDMSVGIRCLLSDAETALPLAQQLQQLNVERKNIEFDMRDQAENLINPETLSAGICLYDKTWHQGVIGIIAGRLKEKFHRPTIIFADSDAIEIKGSGRSLNGIHLRDLLANIDTLNPNLILKFGGHAMAAGLSIKKENFKLFQTAFEAECQKHLALIEAEQMIYTDGELETNHFNPELALQLKHAAPWGQMFPEPCFEGQFKILDQRLVGGKHLQLTLARDNLKYPLRGIMFNIDLAIWPNPRAEKVYVVFQLDQNEYQGLVNLQLLIQHVWVI